MDIKDSGFYSIKEVSKILGFSNRKLQRIAKKKNYRKIDNRYLFTGLQIKEILNSASYVATKVRQTSDEITQLKTGVIRHDIQEIIKEINNDSYVLIVLNAIKDDKHLEEFTDEEYEVFKDRLKEANFLEKRISEYKEEISRMEDYVLDYRNNIEYLKKSLDKRSEETTILLKSIEQRNYIEAKDKGLDKN